MQSSFLNKKLIFELPKVYKRGPAPRIRITSKVLNALNLNEYDNKTAYSILNELYTVKKLSQAKMAKLFNVQNYTIGRWLRRVEIPIKNRVDVVSEAISKHKKLPFTDDSKEKAYLLGLRYGDISAQRHGRSIRVSVSSTHPAMLQLFKETFRIYSSVGIYPKYDKVRDTFTWGIYADLDKSFDFLLTKKETVPKWIKRDIKSFLAFLSGYFDAEGCISISYTSKSKGMQLVLKSCDREILLDILTKLNNIGFHFRGPKLDKKANPKDSTREKKVGFSYKRDYWCISSAIKPDAIKLLEYMQLRHKEKLSKKKLAKILIKNNWKDAEYKITSLRNDIKNDVKKCVANAKNKYKERRHLTKL